MNTTVRRAILVLLVLPEAAASLLRAAPLGWRIALALPVILLPGLLALDGLERRQRRATVIPGAIRLGAMRLGATRLDRLRWLWLPQFGPGLAATLLLGAGFVAAFWRIILAR